MSSQSWRMSYWPTNLGIGVVVFTHADVLVNRPSSSIRYLFWTPQSPAAIRCEPLHNGALPFTRHQSDAIRTYTASFVLQPEDTPVTTKERCCVGANDTYFVPPCQPLPAYSLPLLSWRFHLTLSGLLVNRYVVGDFVSNTALRSHMLPSTPRDTSGWYLAAQLLPCQSYHPSLPAMSASGAYSTQSEVSCQPLSEPLVVNRQSTLVGGHPCRLVVILGIPSRSVHYHSSGWLPGYLPGYLAGYLPGWLPGYLPGYLPGWLLCSCPAR